MLRISLAAIGIYLFNLMGFAQSVSDSSAYKGSIKSVSIISSSAELVNALATPVTVMGIKAGLNLIDR